GPGSRPGPGPARTGGAVGPPRPRACGRRAPTPGGRGRDRSRPPGMTRPPEARSASGTYPAPVSATAGGGPAGGGPAPAGGGGAGQGRGKGGRTRSFRSLPPPGGRVGVGGNGLLSDFAAPPPQPSPIQGEGARGSSPLPWLPPPSVGEGWGGRERVALGL